MAGFNRQRSLDNAKKHIEKGQLDRAIKELKKVLEDQPDDAATRVQMAGVLAKKGDKAEALDEYQKVADLYSKDKDVDRRAIATYEHMAKIDPTRADVRLKLAGLLEKLGRPIDAVREMHIAAGRLEEQGDVEQLKGVLVRMIQLDPSDLPARKKLASLTAKQGAKTDAKLELKNLAAHAKSVGDEREFFALNERMHQLDPTDAGIACELAGLYLKKSKARIALMRLKPAYDAHPQDPRILECLVMAFNALDRPDKAREVAKALAMARSGRADVTLPPVPAPKAR